MNLPKFDKTIPVSLDNSKPNRYGYTKLFDIMESFKIDIKRYDLKCGSQYEISTENYHSHYTQKNPCDMLYAELSSQSHIHYAYLSQELQKVIRVRGLNSLTSKDCYLCLENYVDGKNQICSRYVIDLYYSSYVATCDDIEKEIDELVRFFRGKRFTHSSQVSNYIKDYRLGLQYKNIAGLLKLFDGKDTWEFEGGIDPRYYREICLRLGLVDYGSDAKVIDFRSYGELEKKDTGKS